VDDLGQGPVCDALPVGKATTDDDSCALSDVLHDLARETRLTDTRRAQHRDSLRRVRVGGAFERRDELCELLFATDERRVDPPRERRHVV
jgi:hypothetical protein